MGLLIDYKKCAGDQEVYASENPMDIFFMKDLNTIYGVMNKETIEIINFLSESNYKIRFSFGIKYDAGTTI